MECHSPSPLYEHLSLGVAADPEILALAAHARRGQPAPNLFFAAVYLLLLQGTEHPVSAFYSSLSEAAAWSEDSYPYFRAFCLEQSEEIIDLITSRLVQTNVIRRCSCLLPAFGLIAQQSHGISSALSLIEIGTSAGLNLLWDRYGYDDGEGRQYGDASSPVQLTCEVRGDLSSPIPPVLPTVAFRVGLDLNAVDVHSARATLWLRALIWPEEQDRANLLQHAIQLAQQDPPELIAGDAFELLPDILAAVPRDSALCVFHTSTVNQFSREAREHLSALIAEHGAKRDLFVVSMEGAGLDPTEYRARKHRAWIIPAYSSRHPRGSYVQGNQSDLGNPGSG
jgi:hypothetical protein